MTTTTRSTPTVEELDRLARQEIAKHETQAEAHQDRANQILADIALGRLKPCVGEFQRAAMDYSHAATAFGKAALAARHTADGDDFGQRQLKAANEDRARRVQAMIAAWLA